MVTKFSPKIPNFECIICNLKTGNKKDFNKHNLTAKHIKKVSGDVLGDKIIPIPKMYDCTDCGKKYKSRNGLWKHKKNCIPIQETKNTLLETDEFQNLTNVILDLVKSNADLQKQMLNICKNGNNAHKVDLDSPTPLMS